ncbi:integral membrane protein TmpA [Aspergillus lucknowensis]|uniref:Integral membrane protein TmpA n=1 Tax=Aspergillus lucknowensis TaxID=176173 RepID=A0ABR4L841_9EURO
MGQRDEVIVTRPPTAVCAPESPSEVADAGTTNIEKCIIKDISELKLKLSDDDSSFDLEAQTHKKRWLAPVRYAILNIYRRLFTLVFCTNIGVFVYVLAADRKILALINAAAANLLACGLARQPLIVNTIFVTVCSTPRSAPLWLRRLASKVYHYGGVHSGCGVASLVWYLGFVGQFSREYCFPPGGVSPFSVAPVILTYIILVLLLAIIIVAYPAFRFKAHDYFELTHRFSGWLIVALFIILLMIFVDEASGAEGKSFGRFLIELPAFWFLMVTVVAIVHPWALLRKVQVRPEYLSPHAVRLHFTHTKTTFGKGIQLSKHPLQDWHGFATFPDPDGKSFSCLISKAGDWTSACIKSQPTHLWKRGVLIYGFAYAMRVYKRVVVVTTGSGIGPCLSFLGDENRPKLRVIWQTRSPKRTYGKEVLNLVAKMDPSPIIIDTNSSGRIDMVPVIRQIAKDFDAEAICIVSNPNVTKKVVYELESTGVPAYGPIFDS